MAELENSLIKICGDPHCDAIWHHCPRKLTKCKNCNGNLILINSKTYWKKFSNSFFQYDTLTEEYFRPQKMLLQLQLNFS